MIRGGIRLGILYLIVWVISIYWDAGAAAYLKGIERFRDFFPFTFKVNLFLSFLGMASCCHLAGFWLWIYTTKLDYQKGPLNPPLPTQPLRHYFRLRFRKTTGAILGSLLALLFALQALQNLQFLSFDSAPFSLVYNLPMLPELGSKATPWLVYGSIHLGIVCLSWLLMTAMTLKRLRSSEDLGKSFMQIQAKQNPVAKVFAIVVLFAHLPLAGITAVTHSHPYHGLVILCSLIAMLFAALLGHVIGLGIVQGQDKWLSSLIQAARLKGTFSDEYKIWEATLFFLTGKKPLPLSLQEDNTPSAETPEKSQAKTSKAAQDSKKKQVEARKKGEQLIAKAKTYLENNKVRKARKILQKLANHEDHRIRQHVLELFQASPADSKKGSSFFRLTKALFITTLAAGVLISLGLALQWSTLPGANETRQLAHSAHIHVKKKNVKGESKLELFGNRYDYSLNTSLENISEEFQHAVIASEDHRFFDHGTPYILAKFAQAGILCAAKKINPLSNGACHGNSTLPQQLARNLFLSEERSIARKLSELLWALKMEIGLTKEEILDFYMNRIYLGNGNYGVEMAARDYFKKNASELKTHEAAYLAAAIKRPSWNYHQDREHAHKRARLILALMKQHNYAESKATFPENFRPQLGYKKLHKPYLGHLWQWAKGDVAQIMQSLPDGNYKVLTTLNAEVEIYAEKALQKEISRLRKLGKPVSQGGVVVMRPNGEVLAMVGGVGSRGRYFNRAKRTEGLLPRPPASAFKPFVYLAALESGLKPASSINAGPVSIPMTGNNKPYQPENHDGKVYGKVSLRDGLVYSINTAAVHLLHGHVGFKKLFHTVERLGIPASTLGKQWGLALGQSGVSLIEMTGAYCVFANGGKKVKPYTITAITSESGKTIWHRPEERSQRVFQSEYISRINSMLRDVVRFGTGKRAASGLPKDVMIAGKTGTGDDFVDAWFIGYTADLVIGVWIGNDKPVPMDGVYGGIGPARIFNDILRKLTNFTNITTGTTPLP